VTELLTLHGEAAIALVSAALGAVLGALLGFFGSLWIWRADHHRQRQIARKRIATNLRRWIRTVLNQIYDIRNFDSSDGHAGREHAQIPSFLFEESLEQVASVDYRTADKLFGLIHEKDDANDEIDAEIEFGFHDEPVETWRGRSAQLWLKAMCIYDDIATQVGWSDPIASGPAKTLMQEEVRDFDERKRARAESQAELLKAANV
jgi:hypothetical protein